MRKCTALHSIKTCNALVLLFFIVASLSLTSFGHAQPKSEHPLEWPEVTAETKPATYWWWMGSAVNKKDLRRELKTYKKASLGGTKLIPIYGAKGYEDQFIDYLSPKWMDMLAYTSRVSDRLNMTLDLGAGSGWNKGGPWVDFEDAAKDMVVDTYSLSGGEQLEKTVKHVQPFKTNINKNIKRPVRKNNFLHKHTLYHIQFQRSLPLQSLMAFSDDGDVRNLMGKLDNSRTLNWTAPDGNWTIYAVFAGTHGKTVERAAPGGAGLQLDYLDRQPVLRHMNQFQKAFNRAGYEISDLIRSFHDDSYEQAGSWTLNFFRKFKEIQGYDLQNHLPAFLEKGPDEYVKRVKNDYRETVSHLVVQEHMKTWTDWSHERGVRTINQAAHGSPAHPLDHWASADQPENTGSNPSRSGKHELAMTKAASSAAHVTGRNITSQETATIMYGHFQNSLGQVKNIQIDPIFGNGTNKIYYHSTTYSPENAAWPGWLYYAPTHFVPNNPIWADFHNLNQYVTRISSFLQRGRPDNDLLVYYPINDVWHKKGGRIMRAHNPPGAINSVRYDLRTNGYTYDFISDRQLENTTLQNDRLLTDGGNDYRAVFLPSVTYMPVETLSHLIDLAEAGATIIFSRGLPEKVPSLGRLEQRRKKFEQLIQRLKRFRSRNDTKGRIFVNTGSVKQIVPDEADVPREPMQDLKLKFVRRSHENGRHYFIKNRSEDRIDRYVPLATSAPSVAMFDPMRDTRGMARTRTDQHGRTNVYLQLDPDDTCLLRTFDQEVSGPGWNYVDLRDTAHQLRNWRVEFIDGGPTLPPAFEVEKPEPWTEQESKQTDWFSGTARYTTTFELPSDAEQWILELGDVHQSASVSVNGQHVGTLLSAPFRLNISDALRNGENRISIEVTNLGANRIRFRAQKNMLRQKYYNTGLSYNSYGGLSDPADWAVKTSGLEGPVHVRAARSKSFKQ